MLAAVVRFALSQRAFVLLAAAAFVAAGWKALGDTPVDAFPDVSTTQVKVIVRAPGMTPEEVEARITAPIEIELLGIPRQTVLRSVTKYALADVTVDFEEGTDLYWARQQVGERLGAIWDALPAGAVGGVAPMTTPLGEAFMFTIEGGGLELAERRALLDWVIRPALRTVRGVADVNALGGRVETFEVAPREDAMLAHGIDLGALRDALERNNRSDGAGRVTDGEEALLVRAEGRIRTLDDLRDVVVRADPTEIVRVADVADVRTGALARYGAVTHDGEGEAVEGLVLSLRGANAREVVAGVRAKLEEIAPALPEGVELQVFYDRGELVERAVATVGEALVVAIALVVAVLVAFLADVRAAFVASLVIPASVLGTFVWMRALGMSANLMSLGGLAIAIGMLVDAAVVVIENAVTVLGGPLAGRLPRLHLLYRATREVATPVAAGTAVIVLVFLPLLSLEGLEGKLFVPVALTIVCALATSLALSLTALPVVASYLLRGPARDPRFVRVLERRYARVLDAVLARPRRVLVLVAILLLATVVAFVRIGRTFLPTMDEGSVIVQLEKLPSISLEASLEQDLRIERALLARVPDVAGVVARTGSDEIGLDPMGLNQTDAFLVLRPAAQRRTPSRDALLDELRAVLDAFPGVAYGFTQPIDMRVSEMLTGVRGDVAVKIHGFDLAALDALATHVAATLRGVDGAQDVFRSRGEGAEYLELEVDALEAGRVGLSVTEVQDRLRARLEGVRAGTVFAGLRRIPIVVRGPRASAGSPAELASLTLPTRGAESIPLGSVARARRVEGPVEIKREGAGRFAVVTANVRGRDLVGFVEAARAAVARDVEIPAGFRIEWGGQFENQQRASARLALVVPIALALIFLLLFSTFGSTALAGLVLANIPLALVGGVVALWASGEYLSVPATIGFIALLGIAVLNGVVLVSTFEQLRAEGSSVEAAVRAGAVRRLRPVLMTAMSTALGLVPLLAASGPGAELQRPLAIVVTGGLASSTALTLVLLPLLYRALVGRAAGGIATGEAP